MSRLAAELEIRAILARYGVRSHWKASTEAKATRYALFRDGKQISAPGGHRELQQRCVDMIVADILELMGKK